MVVPSSSRAGAWYEDRAAFAELVGLEPTRNIWAMSDNIAKEPSMPDGATLPVLDHELADDEIEWMKSVYADFSKARAAAGPEFDPKEALRAILARADYRLSEAPDLSGPGPWRLGQNRHGRGVAAVFLPKVELHTHIASRTDQFPMYVVGEAEGFSIDENGRPVLEPVTGGSHFHNAPGAPHAFVPKVGVPRPDNWEIAFIAITPRNLKEDTHRVSDEVRALYRQVVGQEAPLGV